MIWLVKEYPLHVEYFTMVVRRSNVLNDALGNAEVTLFRKDITTMSICELRFVEYYGLLHNVLGGVCW